MSKSLAKATLILTISEIIYNVSSFIIHGAVGRILGPENYGRYGLVITLTTMVIILIGNGIPTAMSKYISEISETKSEMIKSIKHQAIRLQCIIIGAITLIFFLSAPLISKILGDPTLTPLFRISTLIIPTFAAASFYFSYFTGLHKFNIQAILKITRSVARIAAIIGLAYLYKVEGSIVGYIVAPAIVFIVAFIIDKYYSRHPELVSGSKEMPKEIPDQVRDDKPLPSFRWQRLVNYAWQIVIFFLAYELLISIDLYLVKAILKDDYQTGIYNASLTIGRIPYYLFYALTIVLLPTISKSTAEKDHEQTRKLISQSIRIMLILLVPSVILMSVFARPIINLFYSSRFIDAAYPMSILVWGVGFLTIFYVLSFVLNGAGKVKTSMWLAIFGFIINTMLNYILIKTNGIVGSAIATSISSAIATLIMLFFIWKYFSVKIKIIEFLKILLAGAVIYAASLLFSKGSLIFIAWSIVLFALYLLVLYLIKGLTGNDLAYLKVVFTRKDGTKNK